MRKSYDQYLDHGNVPQSRPLPGKDQVQNNAGGYVFKVSDQDRLMRFLVLGISGTYYKSTDNMAFDNIEFLHNMIKKDPDRVLETVIEVSTSGRAISNDPAIATLALLTTCDQGNTKRNALESLHKVCRIPTHLFLFIKCMKTQRGWGRAIRRAVQNWYMKKPIDHIARLVTKYRSRDGFNHRDILRLSHPKPQTQEQDNLFKYIIESCKNEPITNLDSLPNVVIGYEKAKSLDCGNKNDLKTLISYIKDYGLTWEMIPTQALNNAKVWDALVEADIPFTALLRNLNKMTACGSITAFSETGKRVVEILRNKEIIAKSMVHPMTVFKAMSTYNSGQGIKGSLSWQPVSKISSALEDAFYDSFKNVKPSNKNIMIALDVSGSMGWEMVGPHSARELSAVMAMVTMRTEPNYQVYAFASAKHYPYRNGIGIIPLNLTPKMSLQEVIDAISDLPFGSTDCALPIVKATEEELPIDAFIIYTDNETWAGTIHPCHALKQFERKMKRSAKMIVVGMTATDFTIADPTNPNTLDIVGFDSNAPKIISEFIAE